MAAVPGRPPAPGGRGRPLSGTGALLASGAVALQHWPAAATPARGRLVLIHGLSSLADSWWRMGPALARDGWDVTAVDQAGHGGRPLAGEAGEEALVAAGRAGVPGGPPVLVRHNPRALTPPPLLAHQLRRARGRVLP